MPISSTHASHPGAAKRRDEMNATDLISQICENLGFDATSIDIDRARSIKHALEDGEALAQMGLGDDDQDAVEEAHAAMVEIIEDAELSEAPGAPTEVYGGYVWMIGADEFRWSKRATERECRLAVLHAIRLHGVDGAFDLDA